MFSSISILCEIFGEDGLADDRGKERRGAALLGELLVQIGQRESLRRKLAELEERLGPAALGAVLDELEKIVAKMGSEILAPPARTARPATPSPEVGEVRVSDPALKDPFADLLANLHLPEPEPLAGKRPLALTPAAEEGAAKKENVPPPVAEAHESVPPKEKPAAPKPLLREEVDRSPRPEPSPPATVPKLPEPPAPPPAPVEKLPEPPVLRPEPKPPAPVVPPPVVRKPEPPKEKPREQPVEPPRGKEKADMSVYLPKPVLVRSVYPLEGEDVLYLHAVAQIPLEEKPALEPFILEEKGIEAKEFVFALDRGGLRFYLSRLTGKTTNVSKTGMLLLNRKESIHLRGTHFSILNDLRVHGLLLPFEFGTVAMGRDDFHTKVDEHGYELRDALEELVATRWWEVCVYGLDTKMMAYVAPDAPEPRRGERDRRGVDRSGASGSRIDIKTLERILNKQKSIAEEIHRQLEELAVRSDVDLMVNLSSGSSDDWKPILRASYEVGSPEIYRFNHTIIDLQYLHNKYQLMFVLTGDREDFSFQQA